MNQHTDRQATQLLAEEFEESVGLYRKMPDGRMIEIHVKKIALIQAALRSAAAARAFMPMEVKPLDDANAIQIKLVDVIYGNSSLNMTPEACSEQAHRIAAALIAAGLIRSLGQ